LYVVESAVDENDAITTMCDTDARGAGTMTSSTSTPTINGIINEGEWDSATSFDMYRSGFETTRGKNARDNPVLTQVHVLFDCETNIMYVMVDLTSLASNLQENSNDDHFVKINNNKKVDANNNIDGSNFAFVTNAAGDLVGWEASFAFTDYDGSPFDLEIHVNAFEISEGKFQTSGTPKDMSGMHACLSCDGGVASTGCNVTLNNMDVGITSASTGVSFTFELPCDCPYDGEIVPAEEPVCDSVKFDFEKDDDDRDLAGGSYVSRQWQDYGFRISASGGFAPGAYARLFSTSDASGTPALASSDLGNVLIVQSITPQDPPVASDQGVITFAFLYPMDEVQQIGLQNVVAKAVIVVTYLDSDGTTAERRIEVSPPEGGTMDTKDVPINVAQVTL
jgi:hypothetical protein